MKLLTLLVLALACLEVRMGLKDENTITDSSANNTSNETAVANGSTTDITTNSINIKPSTATRKFPSSIASTSKILSATVKTTPLRTTATASLSQLSSTTLTTLTASLTPVTSAIVTVTAKTTTTTTATTSLETATTSTTKTSTPSSPATTTTTTTETTSTTDEPATCRSLWWKSCGEKFGNYNCKIKDLSCSTIFFCERLAKEISLCVADSPGATS